VEKVKQGMVVLQVLCFAVASVIPPTRYTRLLLNFALTKRKKSVVWETSKNSVVSDVGQQ
jgi:hypothetical protein